MATMMRCKNKDNLLPIKLREWTIRPLGIFEICKIQISNFKRKRPSTIRFERGKHVTRKGRDDAPRRERRVDGRRVEEQKKKKEKTFK